MDITTYERRIAEVRGLMVAEQKRHDAAMSALRSEIEQAEVERARILDGLDSAAILLAEHVLEVSGTFARAGNDRNWVIETAIADLIGGQEKLRFEYIGTKDYAHWHGQGVSCEYGYCPRHGSVIFSVGLSRPLRFKSGRPLTADEVNAAVYYLRNIERIQAAQAKASALAAAA